MHLAGIMMTTTRIGLPEQRRAQLVQLLNVCLANTVDLMLQAKTAHWNVKGTHFLSRHEIFDRLAEHLKEHADRIAERAATLGGYAEGTARQVAKGSIIAEYDTDARYGRDHVEALADRLGAHVAAMRNAIGRTAEGDAADPVTENILVEILDEVEMDLWFLENHLDERPGGEPHRAAEAEEAEATLPT